MSNNEIIITCNNCGKELLSVKFINENDVVTKIKVVCGYCHHVSKEYDVCGSFYPGTVSDYDIMEVTESNNTGIIFGVNPK